MRWLIAVVLLASGVCQAQSGYTIPLEELNPSLAIPAMAARDGVVYVAYRSFDLFRFSNQLQVLSYDLSAHRELRHVTISVPKVHGARASEGLFLSTDGKTLAYSETYSPELVLLVSTQDLSEIRRITVLPFAADDRKRMFAGFDGNNILAFASVKGDRLRFIRLNASDLKTATDTLGPGQPNFQSIVWSPKDRITWLPTISEDWQEYTERGQKTGEQFGSHAQYRIGHGAALAGNSTFLAYFGNLSDAGSIVSFSGGQPSELTLPCVPRPYSSGDVAGYAGALCTTSPDREPEHGGDKILSSEFLLLKAGGPTVVWKHPMDFLAVADSDDPDTGVQWGDPLLYRDGSKLLIVAPTKKPELAVYEIDGGWLRSR
jgi:hypothetical protein